MKYKNTPKYDYKNRKAKLIGKQFLIFYIFVQL
jgi:hypothetical protein